MSESSSHKAVLRLLKLLQRQTGRSAFHAFDGPVCIIANGTNSWRFTQTDITRALKAGLITMDASSIRMTDTGLSHLKRGLHPDEPFLMQQTEIGSKQVRSGNEVLDLRHNEKESPLLRLYSRKDKSGRGWLDQAQFTAGERFRSDFEKARLQPRISANWEASVASSNRGAAAADLSDFAIDARNRLDRALDSLGPELAGITLDICCFLKGLELVEREQGWPPRSAKLMLRTALGTLARHYGLASRNNQSDARRRLRHWGAGDYRPGIHGASAQ